MAKDHDNRSHSPLLIKYHKMLESDPRSRVFAPLAESYRKLGMLDKSIEILKRGIAYHPSYILGYLGIAFCYFDLRKFDLAYSTLRPHVESNRDNLRLQKLFAHICHELGQGEEALETYKYLLFINPKDEEAAKYVDELEIEENISPAPIVFDREKKISSEQIVKEEAFPIGDLEVGPEVDANFDDWIQVDLPEQVEESVSLEPTLETQETSIDDWNLSSKIEETLIIIPDEEIRPEKVKVELAEDPSAPVITHTLVDLYCAQGHAQKAMAILENILALNPNDKKTLRKMEDVRALMTEAPTNEVSTAKVEEVEPIAVEPPVKIVGEGHDQLMNLFDSKLTSINNESQEDTQLEDKLWLFYSKIQQRAKEVTVSEK